MNRSRTITSDSGAATIDQETRLVDGDHQALRLWLRMLTCTSLIESPIRTRLRAEFDCSPARFELMAQLERCPNGLKMRELSRRLMVTGGNVTGLTDKLVADGLVERHEDPRDRRAYTVHLTDNGMRLFRKMAHEHERWIESLLAGLSRNEQSALLDLLAKLKHHLANPGNA